MGASGPTLGGSSVDPNGIAGSRTALANANPTRASTPAPAAAPTNPNAWMGTPFGAAAAPTSGGSGLAAPVAAGFGDGRAAAVAPNLTPQTLAGNPATSALTKPYEPVYKELPMRQSGENTPEMNWQLIQNMQVKRPEGEIPEAGYAMLGPYEQRVRDYVAWQKQQAGAK